MSYNKYMVLRHNNVIHQATLQAQRDANNATKFHENLLNLRCRTKIIQTEGFDDDFEQHINNFDLAYDPSKIIEEEYPIKTEDEEYHYYNANSIGTNPYKIHTF